MRKTLIKALEEAQVLENTQPEKKEEVVVEMTGPLSEVYSNALAAVLNKNTEEIALETQAIDATITSAFVELLGRDDEVKPNVEIFGVSPTAATAEDVKEITTKVANADKENESLIIVLDGSNPLESPQETLVNICEESIKGNRFGAAIEALAVSNDVPVMYSIHELKSYLKKRFQK